MERDLIPSNSINDIQPHRVSPTAFVYVIAADNGDVKIGVSRTPYARLSKVKREYGGRRGFADARLVGFIGTPWPMAVESAAQLRLVALAVGGEWFRIDPEQALAVVLEECQAFDPTAEVVRPAPRKRSGA